MTTISNAPTAPTRATDLDAQIDALEDAFQLPAAFVPARRTRRSSRSVDAVDAVDAVDVVAPWTLASRIAVGIFALLAVGVVLMVTAELIGIGA